MLDDLNVYKGLDIITAKVTQEEQSMVPHHMINLVDPLMNYCVVDFKKKALPIINDLVARRKMPIIVGGTNYYIESLLWQILVEDPKASGNLMNRHDGRAFEDSEIECEKETKNKHKDEATVLTADEGSRLIPKEQEKKEEEEEEELFVASKPMEHEDSNESNEVLYRKLSEIDPKRARYLHPNNRRKIIRSLEVFIKHGTTHSEILEHQRNAGGSGLGGPLRFPNSLILWLQCDREVLNERLDRRVDSMVEAGLVQELLDFHERYNEQRINENSLPDYTKGIFQSIGFKEFHNYLILPKDERNSKKGEDLLKQGINDLKLVTKRYAKRQIRWIMNRFLKRRDRQLPPIYSLDCTNVEEWNSKVLEPAMAIIDANIKGDAPIQKSLNEDVQCWKSTDSSNEVTHWCETCEKVLIGEGQFKSHINGARHKRMKRKREKSEDLPIDRRIKILNN
ncbi:tRNA dimethylallyltransferase isoform X2 [Chelonus insularis]|uniref:tRNA dimethylallyltransferase isoform X2 n=1 Tax=Chelonus insularis TaxID=460826 RepID=UPI00158969CD|nr:tRNA dimethylallyltransferase isoform X2 [Chelonus insularis]